MFLSTLSSPILANFLLAPVFPETEKPEECLTFIFLKFIDSHSSGKRRCWKKSIILINSVSIVISMMVYVQFHAHKNGLTQTLKHIPY